MASQLDLYGKIYDGDNLEKLLDIYADRLMGYINSFIKDINSSEDIMMDVFFELLKAKPVFDCEEKLRGWLFKVSKNKALNFLRHNKVFVRLNEEVLIDNQQLERKLYKDNVSKVLHAAIDQLKPKYKDVMYLSYFEGMSIEEVAKILELDERQVRNIKHRAKQKLNEILKKQNFVFED